MIYNSPEDDGRDVYEVSDLINIDACAAAWDLTENQSEERRLYSPDEPFVFMPTDAIKTLEFYANLGSPVGKLYVVELVNSNQ